MLQEQDDSQDRQEFASDFSEGFRSEGWIMTGVLTDHAEPGILA